MDEDLRVEEVPHYQEGQNQGFHVTPYRSFAYSKLSASELQVESLQRLTDSPILKRGSGTKNGAHL